MFRTFVRWVLRLGLVVALGAAVARVLAGRRRDRAGGGILPTVDNDTWPPVPVNPDRVG